MHKAVARDIPRPAGESAGLRDDAPQKNTIQTDPLLRKQFAGYSQKSLSEAGAESLPALAAREMRGSTRLRPVLFAR